MSPDLSLLYGAHESDINRISDTVTNIKKKKKIRKNMTKLYILGLPKLS